jgi:Tol biopolymer transport system component
MGSKIKFLVLLLAVVDAGLEGTTFSKQQQLTWLRQYSKPDPSKGYAHNDPWGFYPIDPQQCGLFALTSLVAGSQQPDGENPLYNLLKHWSKPNGCARQPSLYENDLPTITYTADNLRRIGFDVEDYIVSPNLAYWDEQRGSREWSAGDIIFFYGQRGGHAVVLTDPQTGSYVDQNGNEAIRCWDDFVDYTKPFLGSYTVVHQVDPTKLAGCRDLLGYQDFDSSWIKFYAPVHGGDAGSGGANGHTFHGWHCCWHENLANTWPWYADSTPYACLSWEEPKGITTDSLISPRFVFSGCSSLVLYQDVFTNLLHLSGRVIQIRGSTDDGATWPYLLGTDTTREVALPWAANQPKVRIAWIYHGWIQANRYWCIDNVEVWGKPSRRHDVSLPGVVSPCGPMSIGRTIRPSMYVLNHGSVPESVSTTMQIGAGYSNTKWVKLYPYCDTLLEFPTWTTSPGTFTVTAWCAGDSDEFRRNDTSIVTVRVVSDTWMKRARVYGGCGLAVGGCLATADSDNIFCATGRNTRFARYAISQNLWKTRWPTPVAFNSGAALANPGNGWLYALRGASSKTFCRYNINTNRWQMLPDLPTRVGGGGALAFGGSGYLFALRGFGSRDFYRYSISGNYWQARADVPARVRDGGCLVWTGGDYLYALRGDNTTCFYRYQISTNQWTSLAALPGQAGDGAALAYYPPGNRIYAFAGKRTSGYYVYSITGNTWSSRRSLPSGAHNGACLAYADYSLYGGLGMGRNDDFWRYSPPSGGDDSREPGPEQSPMSDVVFLPLPGIDAGDEVLTNDSCDKFTPRYSPDGAWIACTGIDTLRSCQAAFRLPAQGGNPEALTTDEVSDESPRWLPDGSAVITAGDAGLCRIPASGGERTVLAEGIIANPELTADGQFIMYEKWDSVQQSRGLYSIPISGSAEQCVVSNADEYLQPQPLPDGGLVCVKLKDEVYQLYRIGPSGDQWLTGDYMQNVNPRLSPNRDWVCYQKLDESGFWQVYRIRVDGTDEERLTRAECNCQTPVFSSDGNYVAYTKWPLDSTGACDLSQICYVDVGSTSPGEEVRLNEPDATREDPCWSPDNGYIVYSRVTETGALDGRKKKVKQLARVRTKVKFVAQEDNRGIPRVFALNQNRPNPFRSATSIAYALPTLSLSELTIYDQTGRTVRSLVRARQKPGHYTANWNGTDGEGRRVATGVYFYELKADGRSAQRRMLMVK